MPYSPVLIERAKHFKIDLNRPEGILLVCRSMLEGWWVRFSDDLRKVTRSLDELEIELREIKNALVTIQISQMANPFLAAKYITSIDGILLEINEAYSLVCAASMTLEAGGSTTATYSDVIQSMISCQRTLGRAIQGFRIC
jgi:hypothetical protein